MKFESFYSCVSLMLADRFGIRRVMEWENNGGRAFVETERRYLADPDNARECVMRLMEHFG